ncbi:MAG: hypothetical protein NOF05_13185 [Candidatus Accumulibacter phosphatis]|uniref:DUF4230 domain-containing protein n=1 Tax=Candidatus Accumulibacter cognatus TaxID=2954383 RepID=A0A7D5N9B3_9PROT|nr:hypothetical protein [Candidatus Accumulibacter phosphatis]QLH49735.1 MAG: hypothetical protein HWD57_08030 [Candidatus Accumulibacter cognatus]
MKFILSVIGAAAIAAALTYFSLNSRDARHLQEAQALRAALETKQSELLGYTKYTTFITAGKQALAGQMSLLAAKVTREEGVTQVVERNLLPGLTSTGTVAIWYSAEYSFGFDLTPDQYDVRPVPGGIEVAVKRPRLVATPAVANLRHKILTGGVLTDEKAAALKLQQEAAANVLKQGQAMATEPAIMALCEKKLVEFLRTFLQKQPGVTTVPFITVVYR